MDLKTLEALLYQRESESLDFKRDQYPFDQATDEEKSELLKDILAFANSWRATDAHVLIGVQEVIGGKSIPVGVTDHLLNRNLQQFVDSKVNRPVKFSYQPFTIREVEIGILTIALQDRPIYLHKKFGKVEANTVYIRRGDTTAIASPDEIAEMGAAATAARAQPVLIFDFVDSETREKLGASAVLEVINLEVPASDQIPLYGEPPMNFFGSTPDLSNGMTNRDYYRDLAVYIKQSVGHKPIRFAITNTSETLAEGVLLTLSWHLKLGVVAVEDGDLPSEPSTLGKMPHIHPRTPRNRHIEVDTHGDRVEVRLEFDAIQPGVTASSENAVYIGAEKTTQIVASGTISANNLSKPVAVTAELRIEATASVLDVSQMIAMDEKG